MSQITQKGRVESAEFAAKDRRRAQQIHLYALISAAIITLILMLIP